MLYMNMNHYFRSTYNTMILVNLKKKYEKYVYEKHSIGNPKLEISFDLIIPKKKQI